MSATRRQGEGLGKIAWVAIALVTLAGLVWIALLPMRQTEFRLTDHAIVRDGAPVIAGRLVHHGEGARRVLVEAYLYDSENRYLGTVGTTVSEIGADGETDFRIPLEVGTADRVERYSLYAGTSPNPYAPDR